MFPNDNCVANVCFLCCLFAIHHSFVFRGERARGQRLIDGEFYFVNRKNWSSFTSNHGIIDAYCRLVYDAQNPIIWLPRYNTLNVYIYIYVFVYVYSCTVCTAYRLYGIICIYCLLGNIWEICRTSGWVGGMETTQCDIVDGSNNIAAIWSDPDIASAMSHHLVLLHRLTCCKMCGIRLKMKLFLLCWNECDASHWMWMQMQRCGDNIPHVYIYCP